MTKHRRICYQSFVKIKYLTRYLFQGLIYLSVMWQNIRFLSFLLISQWCCSQVDKINLVLIDHISIQADHYWGNDGLGNYFYSTNSVLYKKNNETVIQYQNLPLGDLKKVDLTNPLRPVLFYENFNTVVLLDNYLNEIQSVNFSNLPVPIVVNSVGMSNQNRLWVYDASLQQVGLYHLTSTAFSPIGNPVQGNWNYYQCSFNSLDWIDAQYHWKRMTIYGQITDLGTVPKNIIQLLDNQKVLYLAEGQLFLKSLVNGKIHALEIVEKSIKKIYCNEQILSIFTDKGITNYKITIP
jgi:hypothetical protein